MMERSTQPRWYRRVAQERIGILAPFTISVHASNSPPAKTRCHARACSAPRSIGIAPPFLGHLSRALESDCVFTKVRQGAFTAC
jgi:hypothetical protein